MVYFRFNNGSAEEHTIELLTMNGQTLCRRITCDKEYEMDISDYPDGMYLVRITGDKSMTVRKIILKH
jgi:hypothetical protein